MLQYLILGATYAFAAAVQPGPFQAYLISQAMIHGWRRTLPAALAPVLSDIPIICLVLLVLGQVPAAALSALQLSGGVFLIYLAWRAFGTARAFRTDPPGDRPPVHQTMLKAVLVNLLNPSPYLGWTLVMGPLLLQAWRQQPAYGVALVASFYLTMVIGGAGVIAVFAVARSAGPRLTRIAVRVSAVGLAAFGIYQIVAGSAGLVRGLTHGWY